MKLERSSGILLHPTSLPSDFNIGDFGPAARLFVDRLAEAGQRWWQILPLTPPGYGGSPYASTSSFAINLAMVDPLWLVGKKFITEEELEAFKEEQPPEGALVALGEWKRVILDAAYQRWRKSDYIVSAESFVKKNKKWLKNDALFVALKQKYDDKPWYEWAEGLVRRDPDAIQESRKELKEAIDRFCFAQWVANTQWQELRDYAKAKGIQLIGDIPIFVAMDSSDVWVYRNIFEVDDDGTSRVVAGVPPDYFSATGQKWGNPLYRWNDAFDETMSWWVDRVKRATGLVDLIRIDHFRAFADYWEIPAEAPTAETGAWKTGPGDRFFSQLKEALGEVPFIAEDLGIVSDEVYALRDRNHLPGMKILEFAFDGNPEHPFLPHMYPELCVAYPGTHDNNTIVGWRDHDASPHELHEARVYLSSSNEDLPRNMMISLAESEALLVIFQLQDLFELPATARMNTPGVPEGNWTWRMTHEMLRTETQHAWKWLREITLNAEREP